MLLLNVHVKLQEMKVQGQFSNAENDVCQEVAKVDIKHDVEPTKSTLPSFNLRKKSSKSLRNCADEAA